MPPPQRPTTVRGAVARVYALRPGVAGWSLIPMTFASTGCRLEDLGGSVERPNPLNSDKPINVPIYSGDDIGVGVSALDFPPDRPK